MVNSMVHRRLSIYITPSNPQHMDWLPCPLRVSTQTHLPFPGATFEDTSQGLKTHPGISPPVLYSQASSDAHGYQLPRQLLWLELRITRQRSAQNRSALTVSTLLSKSKPMKSMTREPEGHAHADIVPDTWRRWFNDSGSSLGLGGGRQPILLGVQAFLKF